MKITSKEQKAILFSLFIERTGQVLDGKEVIKEKSFSLDQLMPASSAYRRIKESCDDKFMFIDSEIEFTPEEVVVLKQLFDGKREWTVSDAEAVQGLKNIFEGKEVKQIN